MDFLIPDTPDNAESWILGGSFALAFILVVVAAAPSRFKLGEQVGNPEWNFSESWATTLTAVGALLGTILAENLFPQIPGGEPGAPIDFPTVPFQLLNLFSGILVVLAPLIYAVSKVRKEDVRPKQYVGKVWGLLLACMVTLWGVFGQLGTLMIMLVPELHEQNVLNKYALAGVQATLLIGAICAAYYAVRTINWKIQDDTGETLPLDDDGRVKSWSLL